MSCPQCVRAVSMLVQLLSPPHADEVVADARSDATPLRYAAGHVLVSCVFFLSHSWSLHAETWVSARERAWTLCSMVAACERARIEDRAKANHYGST